MNYRIYILTISVLVISCSKERRIERKITNSWEISSSHATWTDKVDGAVSEKTLNYDGFVYFEEDQTGYSDTASSNPFPIIFTWTNTDEKLIITDSTSKKQYNLTEFTKTRMYLEHIPPPAFPSEKIYREYMVLKKLK